MTLNISMSLQKLVGVGIYNYSLVDDNGLRHTMAKRGGLKICRELLEEGVSIK